MGPASTASVKLVLCFTICAIFTARQIDAGLYSANEAVIILSVSNYQQVYDSEFFWLVELYSSMCPHCIMYSDLYKELSRAIVDWSAILKVAAVDCADVQNVVLCSQMNINLLPAFRFYSPFHQAGAPGEMLAEMTSVVAWKQILLSRIISSRPASITWLPEFQPYTNLASLRASSQNKKAELQLVILEFTNSDPAASQDWQIMTSSISGVEVQLAFSSPTRQIRRLLINKNDEAAKREALDWLSGNRADGESVADFEDRIRAASGPRLDGTDTSLVRVYHLQPDQKTYHLIVLSDEREVKTMLKKHLKLRLPSDFLEEQLQSVDSLRKVSRREDSDFASMYLGPLPLSSTDVHRIHMQDLESCIYYMLTREIPLASKISGERFDALARFLNVLAKYFVGRDPLMRFLRSLSVKIHEYSSDIGFSGTEWLWMLVELQQVALHRNEFLPAPVTVNGVPQLWNGCATPRGARHRGGYTCALWQLFHMLTVSHWLSFTDPHWRVSHALVEDNEFAALQPAFQPASSVAAGVKTMKNVSSSKTVKKSSQLSQKVLNKRSLLGVIPPESDVEPDGRVAEVILAFRGYIFNFFACTECKENFRAETAALDRIFRPSSARGGRMPAQRDYNAFVSDVGDAEFKFRNFSESPLFAWSIHNAVNTRLSGEGREDASQPKAQFPPISLCPTCRFNVSEDEHEHEREHESDQKPAFAANYEKVSWNLDEVLVFLRLQIDTVVQDAVGVRNINSILQTQLNLETPDGGNLMHRIVAALGFLLSPSDVRLMFCVYALVICVLLVFYVYFIYKCRRLTRLRRIMRSFC